MSGGTYTLVIELPVTDTIEVGALGEIRFQSGWYAYAGSANGPGGFARVDRHALTDELKAMLREEYPKWWLPDGFEFIDEIPKTATGKFSKKDLREQYAGAELLEETPPEESAPE